MIDTGATTSIMNPGIINPIYFKQIPYDIIFKTLNEKTNTSTLAEVPEENVQLPLKQTFIKFFIYKFHDSFDGILANDILTENAFEINYNDKTITLNDQKMSFYFSSDEEEQTPQNISELYQLSEIKELNFSKNIKEEIRTEH